MSPILNQFQIGIEVEPTVGTPRTTALGGTFTVGAITVPNSYNLTIITNPYLALVTANGVGYAFLNDASESVAGYTRVLVGATTATAATNLATALTASGLTATTTGSTITISSTGALTITTTERESDIIIDHQAGINQIDGTGSITLQSLPANADKIVVGAKTFEFYTTAPYAGANVGVLITTPVANTIANLKTAIDAQALGLTTAITENTVLLTGLNTTVTTTSPVINVVPVTGFVSPASAVSTITLNTNFRINDKVGVNNGAGNKTYTITTLGATPTASATSLATLINVDFTGIAVATGNKITLTYGAARGNTPTEPSYTPDLTIQLTLAQISTASSNTQKIVSGALNAYAKGFAGGQTITASNSGGSKDFTVVSYSTALDALVVIPTNGVQAAVGTVYTSLALPPQLLSICVTGGGVTIANEKTAAPCIQEGLMGDPEIITGFTPTIQFEMLARMSPPVKLLIENALHSSGWMPSVSVTSTITLTKTAVNGRINTYTAVVSNPAMYNTLSFSEGVPFKMSGWTDTKKNAFVFTFTAITATGFTFDTPRILTTPESATVVVTTAEWLRNAQTMSAFDVGQYDGFEYILARGCCASSFEITSSGAEPVKMTSSAVSAGGVLRNPRPSINNGNPFPYWIGMTSEASGQKFLSKTSLVYLNDDFLPVTECAVKLDALHTAEVGGSASEELNTDEALYPSLMTYSKVEPTFTCKTPMSAAQFALYAKAETSCTMSVKLRFVAKDSCTTGQTKMSVIMLGIPRVVATPTPDSPSQQGARYVSWEGKGGRYVPTLVQSGNSSAAYSIQIAYFDSFSV